MAGFAYPYDPTGNAATNLVSGEVHDLAEYTNKWRCIIPLFAPFYRGTLIVKYNNQPLREGIDYYLGHYFKEGADETKRPIFGSIMLQEALVGKITFEAYQTLGGAFTIRRKDALEHLAKQDLKDPRNDDWSSVMKYARPVPPITVPEDVEQAIATDPIIKELDDIVKALEVIGAKEQVQYRGVFDRIYALGEKIRAYDFADHASRHAAHRPTYAQLGALGKDQTAVDALRAYGRTLAELTALIGSMGITSENVARYYTLLGGVFKGRLTFKDADTCLIQNQNGTSMINFRSGNINILSKGDVSLIADSDKNSNKAGALFPAGNNMLSVHSSLTVQEKNYGMFNGFYLIHVGNIKDYMDKVQVQTGSKFDLNVMNSATANLSGKGTIGNPLTGSVTFPVATAVVAGMVRVSGSLADQSIDAAASVKALYELSQNLATYVVNTRKVQTRPLTSDITITKADIGRGKLQNTTPDEKLPSTAFTQAVAGKAPLNHTHNLAADGFLPEATNVARGIVQLTNSTDVNIKDKAATPSVTKYYNDLVTSHAGDGNTKLSNRYINVIEYASRATGTLGSFPANSFVFTFKADLRFYINRTSFMMPAVVIDLAARHPDTYRNRKIYAFIEEVNGTRQYVTDTVKGDDTDTRSFIGTFVTSDTGITSFTKAPFVRLLNVAELLAHLNDPNAHGWGGDFAKLLGLTNVQNKALTDTITFPTFKDTFDNWYRFSHGGTNTYPMLPEELLAWEYMPATDSIRNTTNSTSFIGFVSNEEFGDYEFDAEMSSINADDDMIGLVLGYYKDPVTGKENTLTVLRNLGSQNAGDHTVRYFINYAQHDNVMLKQAGSRTQIGWSTAGTTRVKAKRTGNKIAVTVYGFTAVDGGAITDEYVIDLTSHPKLSVFLGKSKYGYCAHSQAMSTWLVRKRPDDDGTNFYASMAALRTVANSLLDKTVIVQGRVNHGIAVPIPIGYDPARCQIVVLPESYPNTEAITAVECNIANGLVNCRARNKSGTWVNGIALYYLIGSK